MSMTRRQLLGSTIGSMAIGSLFRGGLVEAAAGLGQAKDVLAERRAQMGAVPIVSTRLADNLTMLGGPGGNVVVLTGPDGKLLVDSFVQPAFAACKQVLDKISGAPIKLLIDTHWHFDHTDNNENFHKAGATILAHVNTKKRLSQTHDILGMHFAPSPAGALPTQTFLDKHALRINGEQVEAGRIPPAHTDTDLYVHFARGNVLHMGDVYFSDSYPFIDASTGGHINGQISGAMLGLKVADNATKIVPGHGPLSDKAGLTTYRDMLVTVRDRVQKLKSAGRTLQDVQAAKVTADLDATWGKGFLPGNDFVAIVYSTLK